MGRRSAASRRRMLFAHRPVTMFTIGGLSGVTHAIVPGRLPADRHVLHRRALPLRALRRQRLRLVRAACTSGGRRSSAMLVRALGKVHFWIDAHRVQPDVRADAHPGSRGHVRRDTPTPEAAGFTFWNMVVLGRRVHDRGVGPAFFVNVVLNTQTEGQGRPREPADPWDARTLEWMTPSRRPSATSTRSSRCTRSTSSGTASTSRTREGELVPVPGRRLRTRGADEGHAAAGHWPIHLPSPSYWPLVAAPACRSSATASSTRGGCVGAGASVAFWSAVRGWASRALGGGGRSRWRDRATNGRRQPSTRRVEHGHARPPRACRTPRSAMWLFLASECLLFGALISTYLLYRVASARRGPYPEESSTSRTRRCSSFVLLMSSLTMVLALRRAAARHRPRCGCGCWPPRCSG